MDVATCRLLGVRARACLLSQILLAPAGGKVWDATDPYTDYYGPDGGPLDFSAPPDVSEY